MAVRGVGVGVATKRMTRGARRNMFGARRARASFVNDVCRERGRGRCLVARLSLTSASGSLQLPPLRLTISHRLPSRHYPALFMRSICSFVLWFSARRAAVTVTYWCYVAVSSSTKLFWGVTVPRTCHLWRSTHSGDAVNARKKQRLYLLYLPIWSMAVAVWRARSAWRDARERGAWRATRRRAHNALRATRASAAKHQTWYCGWLFALLLRRRRFLW